MYEHTKIRAVAAAQVLRVIKSVVWAKWRLRFCVSLLIRRFSLRLRSRAEWSGVPPKAVREAESRNKTLGQIQLYMLRYLQRSLQSVSTVVRLQCFYWLNNVFYSFTQLSLKIKAVLTQCGKWKKSKSYKWVSCFIWNLKILVQFHLFNTEDHSSQSILYFKVTTWKSYTGGCCRAPPAASPTFMPMTFRRV